LSILALRTPESHQNIRRARLLGLDAPQKLDIQGLYRIGGDQQSAERLARERVLEAVPLDEQERMYEVLAVARKRVEAADIETTATRVTNGPFWQHVEDPLRVLLPLEDDD
jgi:hypothetical protein